MQLMKPFYNPEPGIALVKLIPPSIKVPAKTYDSIMEGEIVALHKEDKAKNYLLGKIGHWRQFKDDLRLKDDYAFVELRDIFGTHEKGE